ncbi:MAG: FkbM family methyltransferase [bacterium]|nr:FkbM family methyltransferase [bacterium]
MDKQEIYRVLNEAYFGRHCDEAHLFAQIEPLVSQARHFVDVGASLGQYTRFACRAMKPGSEVTALEADPIRFEELERNCADWGRGRGVTLRARFGAATDREGPVRFHSTQSNTSGGLFERPNVADDIQWTELEVPGYKLDDLFPETPPDFVKIDVEGAELRVLRGAENILRAHRTIFFVEVHSWPDPQGQANPEQVLTHMRERGYHRASLSGKSLFHPDRRVARKLTTRSRLRGAMRRLRLAP